MPDVSMAVVFGIITMFGFGLGVTMAKPVVTKIGSIKSLFFREIIITIILLCVLLLTLPGAVFSMEYILIAVGIGLVSFIAMLSFYKSMEKGKVGVVAPVANISSLITILLSIVFFGEVLSAFQTIAIFVILMGVVLISLNFRDLRGSSIFNISTGVPFAVLTCLLWGVVFFLTKIPVSVLGPILSAFINESIILVMMGITMKAKKESLNLPDRKTSCYLALSAVFPAVALLAFNFGVQSFNVSIIMAFYAANPLVAAISSRLIHKEQLSRRQWFSILLIISGVLVISVF